MAAVLPALAATLAMQAIVVIASLIVPITIQESAGAPLTGQPDSGYIWPHV